MAKPYEVEWDPTAREDLKRIRKDIAEKILLKVNMLAERISTSPTMRLEALTGRLRGSFKLKLGSYRVIYELRHSERLLYVHFVAHRREAYREK